MGIGKLLTGVARKAYRYVRYGKQIGKVHADGSTLHESQDIFGIARTKCLVGKDGDVKKIITRERYIDKRGSFKVTQATPKDIDKNGKVSDWNRKISTYKMELADYDREKKYIHDEEYLNFLKSKKRYVSEFKLAGSYFKPRTLYSLTRAHANMSNTEKMKVFATLSTPLALSALPFACMTKDINNEYKAQKEPLEAEKEAKIKAAKEEFKAAMEPVDSVRHAKLKDKFNIFK